MRSPRSGRSSNSSRRSWPTSTSSCATNADRDRCGGCGPGCPRAVPGRSSSSRCTSRVRVINGPSPSSCATGSSPATSCARDRLFEAAEESTRLRVPSSTPGPPSCGGSAERPRSPARRRPPPSWSRPRPISPPPRRCGRRRPRSSTRPARRCGRCWRCRNRGPLTGQRDYPLRPAIGVKIDNSDRGPTPDRPDQGRRRLRHHRGGRHHPVPGHVPVPGRRRASARSVRPARRTSRSWPATTRPSSPTPAATTGCWPPCKVAPMTSLTEASAPRARSSATRAGWPPTTCSRRPRTSTRASGSQAGVPNPQFIFRKRRRSRRRRAGRWAGCRSTSGSRPCTYRGTAPLGSRHRRRTDPGHDRRPGLSRRTSIVQFTNYATSPADAESPDALTVGQGDAWIFTDGKVIEARWARSGIATSPVQYIDAGGKQIPSPPARPGWSLPRPGNAVLSLSGPNVGCRRRSVAPRETST